MWEAKQFENKKKNLLKKRRAVKKRDKSINKALQGIQTFARRRHIPKFKTI